MLASDFSSHQEIPYAKVIVAGMGQYVSQFLCIINLQAFLP